MSRIQALETLVVNKIAAGEVVERPGSVVKELLENSVDALASRVEVDIVEGGSELIRVADDGEGIHPDDLLLAVTSHATSKIRGADDLFRVRTMGFRGEALASIASISRFRLRSRQAGSDHGCEVTVDGGQVEPLQPCGCPVGTVTEVRSLFFNTPVRRKFLRSVPTEFGHISEHFTRIALACPRLSAVLRHNERMVYELPATDHVLDRLRLFFGSDLADRLIWVESQTDSARLWGYVGHPSESRSTRKGQYLFLNGRFIQDRSLQHALGEAYRGLLMTGRYPVAFLFLELSPELVDVNIHPTKAEVRFRDSQSLYRQLLSTLRTRFLTADLDSTVSLPTGLQLSAQRPAAVDPKQQLDLQLELATWAKDRLAQWMPPASVPAPFPGDFSADEGFKQIGQIGAEPFRSGNGLGSAAPDSAAPYAAAPADAEFGSADPASLPTSSGARQIMQVHDCYLVVETDEGITVIDQHALHERVMYEHLRCRVIEGAVESQRTLVPQPLEFGPSEAAALLENKDLLSCLGYGVEEFGGTTLLLAAYPAMLAQADHGRILADIADQLAAAGQKPSRRDILDSLLHLMACKAAVKAGQRLKPEEMESLLAQRHLIDDAHHCPHGRPTALVLTRTELDRQFGRLG
ncbi:MAG TPA: DNA mismatch repair endonuclease MutL [Planctomycetaceae bacterium]|jgi:DNA mismatch repair protein MutL|nr:DNA mismatch repair endonuclease MutL [Planctomycetaceae bacterium]